MKVEHIEGHIRELKKEIDAIYTPYTKKIIHILEDMLRLQEGGKVK